MELAAHPAALALDCPSGWIAVLTSDYFADGAGFHALSRADASRSGCHRLAGVLSNWIRLAVRILWVSSSGILGRHAACPVFRDSPGCVCNARRLSANICRGRTD